jgi:hypothetical protein
VAHRAHECSGTQGGGAGGVRLLPAGAPQPLGKRGARATRTPTRSHALAHLTSATPMCLHSISAASARPMVGLGFMAVSCCSTDLTCGTACGTTACGGRVAAWQGRTSRARVTAGSCEVHARGVHSAGQQLPGVLLPDAPAHIVDHPACTQITAAALLRRCARAACRKRLVVVAVPTTCPSAAPLPLRSHAPLTGWSGGHPQRHCQCCLPRPPARPLRCPPSGPACPGRCG